MTHQGLSKGSLDSSPMPCVLLGSQVHNACLSGDKITHVALDFITIAFSCFLFVFFSVHNLGPRHLFKSSRVVERESGSESESESESRSESESMAPNTNQADFSCLRSRVSGLVCRALLRWVTGCFFSIRLR